MVWKAFGIGLLLGLLGAVAPGCGAGKPACLPQTCLGCCDSQGNCQLQISTPPGNTNFCGNNANACTHCLAGQSCSGGTCTGVPDAGPGTCGNGGTCHGCCDSNNTCQTGLTAQACGKNGARCVSCGTQQCISQACGACAGCIDGSGACQAGNQNTACGTGGVLCVTCTGALVCTPNAGGARCAAPTCSPATCPNGCCQNGTCVNPPTAAACGTSGNACTQCPSGENCISGQCSNGSPDAGGCTFQSCLLGCCDNNGACQTGTTDTACGGPIGLPCQNCIATDAGTCQAGFPNACG